MNAQNVSTGKPTGGAISVAPLATALPTDAVSTLNVAFKSLGYISDAGVVNTNTPSNTDIKAWGGDTVISVQTEKPDSFKFTLIESTDLNVLKTVYNDDNVEEIEVGESGNTHTEIKVTANSDVAEYKSFVIDMIMKAGTVKRIVIPSAKVTSLSDITYSDSTAVGYEVTITAVPDTNGNTHYEYIK